MFHKDHFTDLYDSIKAYKIWIKLSALYFFFVSAVRLYA